jgi:hypothetical protein
MFDANDLTWRMSEKKIQKTLQCIKETAGSDHCTLKQWQKLMGRINDICQMCPFLKIFKHPINECISGIDSAAPDDTKVNISEQAQKDLLVWAGYLLSEFKWLPICPLYTAPPRVCKEFVSDAAGLASTANFGSGPGCGNVGFAEDGAIIFAYQFTWPEQFIRFYTDEKGVRFGDKTTTLEVIGLLMPLLLVPELLMNQHVRIMVDCLGTVFGMQNKSASGDKAASVFIRAAHLIANYLGCVMHVEHLPRVSDWGAEVTDRLSRKSSTTHQDRRLISAFKTRSLPSCLHSWFLNPTSDFGLAMSLLAHVKRIV